MVINMNYPKGIVKPQHNSIIYSNRGMNLESDLNATCEYYLQNDKAIIYKKQTPITISKVDYTNKKDAVIKEGHFRIPSTTDYNGIYKGKYIDFEAKETKCESFPLRNIHAHQIKHLRSIVKHGGIGFLIVIPSNCFCFFFFGSSSSSSSSISSLLLVTFVFDFDGSS